MKPGDRIIVQLERGMYRQEQHEIWDGLRGTIRGQEGSYYRIHLDGPAPGGSGIRKDTALMAPKNFIPEVITIEESPLP